jgi:putative tricarboxylic transport membrane protein
MGKSLPVAGVLVGLGLLIVAAVIGWDAMNMRVPPVHAKVGPRVFPYLVSSGLAIAGLLTALSAKRGGFPDAEGDTDWRAFLVISAGLVLQLNMLKPLGFIPAGIVLFMSVAIGFGSRAYMRDLFVAIVVVALTYIGFTRLLGLQLPPGIFKGLL